MNAYSQKPAANTPRHPQTGASLTSTPEAAQPRPGPTPAEINQQQKAQAEQVTRTTQERQHEARNRAMATSPSAPPSPANAVEPVQSQMLTGPRSDAAFERNMQELGGPGNPLLIPNLLEGDFRAGGEVINIEGTHFVMHTDEARRGTYRFHGPGNPPTRISVGMYEDATLPAREELGDLDPRLWELDKYKNVPTDPWQPEIMVPIVSTAPDGTVYELTSRSPTALFAIKGLLDRAHKHPQRAKGLVPIVTMRITTYFNKNQGRDMYKPAYQITGWCTKDGSTPAKKPDSISSGPFNDQIPF
jgi:hypothetical protein